MKNKDLTKKQLKDLDIFVDWIKKFWILNEKEKIEMIANTDEDYFKLYLNKIKDYNKEEQDKEINYILTGEE